MAMKFHNFSLITDITNPKVMIRNIITLKWTIEPMQPLNIYLMRVGKDSGTNSDIRIALLYTSTIEENQTTYQLQQGLEPFESYYFYAVTMDTKNQVRSKPFFLIDYSFEHGQ